MLSNRKGYQLKSIPTLPFHGMDTHHVGLTKAIADSYTEAARVCLDRHHQPPTDFSLQKLELNISAIAQWETTDEQTRRAWFNETDTTESGAYSFVLAAVELLDEYVAIHRAETRTGADYYIAPKGAKPDHLEDCLRLEVSGVDRGSESTVKQRLNLKLKQAAQGNSNLPAVAGVVGFRIGVVMLAPLEP